MILLVTFRIFKYQLSEKHFLHIITVGSALSLIHPSVQKEGYDLTGWLNDEIINFYLR